MVQLLAAQMVMDKTCGKDLAVSVLPKLTRVLQTKGTIVEIAPEGEFMKSMELQINPIVQVCILHEGEYCEWVTRGNHCAKS